MSFRDRVIEEANAQRALRAQRQPIPGHLRRYARLAGLGVMLTCTLGSIVIAVLGYFFGALYWFAILFLVVLAGMGFLQLVTGRHLMTGR
jgi:hypothetical protein